VLLFLPDTNRSQTSSDVAAKWIIIVFLQLVFFVPAVLVAVWLRRAEIVADEETLCWQGLGRRRCVRWEDVTDYYDLPLPRGKRSAVETVAGKLPLWGDSVKNIKPLRVVIERQVTNARARGWGVVGARPEDPWPRVFHYNSSENRVVMPGIIVFSILGWCTLLASQTGNHWRMCA
jgi:hypothetical protein